jgi:hypothetical protein
MAKPGRAGAALLIAEIDKEHLHDKKSSYGNTRGIVQ